MSSKTTRLTSLEPKTNYVDCIFWDKLAIVANNKKRRTIMRSISKNIQPAVLAGALTLIAVCLSVVLAHAEPDKKTDTKPAPKKLTGAELYAINCNRCHPERYATEFTSAQWKTIMTHMRVRANLPAAQAKLILKFLQEDAGN
jgi:mono/diheme cytochrome c family protein